jgi:hypothetical protein
MWLFVHVAALIDPRHRRMVLREWLWAYFTRERSALLITGDAKRITTTFKPDEVKLKT